VYGTAHGELAVPRSATSTLLDQLRDLPDDDASLL
jgi:hypothetical protein